MKRMGITNEWLNKTAANFSSPAEPEEKKTAFPTEPDEKKPAVSFQSIFGTIVFFFFHISIILIIPILPILIPEETKKTRSWILPGLPAGTGDSVFYCLPFRLCCLGLGHNDYNHKHKHNAARSLTVWY